MPPLVFGPPLHPSSALAGVWPLSPARTPVGVDLKAPRADLAIWLMARRCFPSIPFCPFQVSFVFV